MSEINLFFHLAQETSSRMKAAYELGISQREDTFTESNLLDIARSRYRSVQIIKALPAEEAQNGFDFEIWIEYPRGWYGFAIQAKKLDVASNRYKELRHFVPSSDDFQINLLKEYANKQPVSPLYCFYNYCEKDVEENHWNCNFAFVEGGLGCSLLPLSDVEPWHVKGKSRSFEALHSEKSALPWHCLFCPNLYTPARGEKLSHLVLEGLEPAPNHPYAEILNHGDEPSDSPLINEKLGMQKLKELGTAPKNIVIAKLEKA